jgi:hypothetical protein
MRLTPDRVVLLDHRAYFLRVAAAQPVLAAVGWEGRIALIGSDFVPREIDRPPTRLRDLCVHPTEPLLGLIEEHNGALSLIDFDGSPRGAVAPPSPARRLSMWSPCGFHSCIFDIDRQHLWCVASESAEALRLQLVRIRGGEVVASLVVEDPFGHSTCSFLPTRMAGVVALWVAAGQDGQKVYWLSRDAYELRADPEPSLEDTWPPVFAPNGREFLVLDEQQRLCRYAFPAGHLLGACEASEEDGNAFGVVVSHLDDAHALVSDCEGGMHLVRTETMEVAADVQLIAPELSTARPGAPAVDIYSFERFGDAIVFIVRRDGGKDLEGWTDALLRVPVSAIVNRLTP